MRAFDILLDDFTVKIIMCGYQPEGFSVTSATM